MKNTTILILFNLICLIGFSQSNIRLNNYWENTYYINPASIYSEYKFVASVAGRKQWIGFPGAPDTEYITFASKLSTKKNTQIGQIGFKIFRDKIGYTNKINISPSYSYSAPFNKFLMNFGIAYKVQRFSYNMTKLILDSLPDPAININENKWSDHNVDLGVEFVGKSMLIGLAGQNLLSQTWEENKYQTTCYFLYGMRRLKFDDSFYFQLGICGIKNENLYQLEFNVSSFFNSNNHFDLYQLGFFYRTRDEFGFLFGMDLDNLLFGRDLDNSVRLACTYDYNFGGISHSSFGTTEIMLIWKFGKIPDCHCRDLFK